MAEALAVLGAVGSAVGLLDFTIKVVDRVNHFIRSVDEVPDTLRDVKLQLPLFIVALQRIQFHLDHGHFEPQTSLALKLSLDECLSQMIFLDNMLIKLTPVEKDSKIKRSRKAIYSLKEESILEKTVARISGYIEKLLLLQNSITSGNIMRNMSLVLKQMESQYSPRDGAASSSALESSGMVVRSTAVTVEESASRMASERPTYYKKGKSRTLCYAVNLTRFGLLCAFSAGVEVSWGNYGISIAPSIHFQQLVKYTSPGSELFYRCYMDRADTKSSCEGLVELFRAGKASPRDTFPDGRGWIERILTQRIVSNIDTPLAFLKLLCDYGTTFKIHIPLLHLVARWKDIGAHLISLDKLLAVGYDCSAETSWPQNEDLSNILWNSENDPFLLQFLTKCSKVAHGVWGQTPLMDNILCGTMTEVSRSLRNSKDHLQRKNDLGQTAAHMAVLRPEILSLLLRKGSDFDAVDNQGNSPLIYAASYEQIESLMILLKGGANPVQDGRIRVLDNAMSRGQWSMVGKLLESFRINTCLSRELLQREIDNFMLANWPEWGPIKKSYKKFLDQMISIGANKHAVDKDGNTLLHLSNNRDAVAALFGQGFDLIDHPNNKGRTALMQSILINSRENYTADVILTRGCDLDHQDEDGKTALHLAYMRLSDLTQPQIDVDNDFWATRRNYPPSMILILIARLLSQGANMFISDRCRCPCCPDGCPPFLQLPCVQRLMGDYPSSNDAMGYIWILETLLTLLESGLVDSARKMLLALKRAREFDLAGMTHVCCRRKVISELGPLDDEDIDEILDEEREDILTLDKKMGGVEATQGTKSLEESWLNVLLKLPSGNEKTKQPGEWAYYDTVYSIWISDGGKTLRNRPHPCLPVDEERFLLVDEEVDQYVRFRKGWSYLPRSQMYLAWVEWFYNNRTEFEYPSPIDENWYTKRKYWATRQAEVLERAKSSNELLNDNKAP